VFPALAEPRTPQRAAACGTRAPVQVIRAPAGSLRALRRVCTDARAVASHHALELSSTFFGPDRAHW